MSYTFPPSIQEKISLYTDYLFQQNQLYDLVGFKTIDEIEKYQIEDSLKVLITYPTLHSEYKTITDIGTGAGGPGLILAITQPHQKYFLVEVQQKRINFLNECIDLLGISNCTIIPYDFKTVIRKKMVPLHTLFISRATLPINELLFIYNNNSAYIKNDLIYWSNHHHTDLSINDMPHNKKIESLPYTVGIKNRFYVKVK